MTRLKVNVKKNTPNHIKFTHSMFLNSLGREITRGLHRSADASEFLFFAHMVLASMAHFKHKQLGGEVDPTPPFS